jgi:hypothetical protein
MQQITLALRDGSRPVIKAHIFTVIVDGHPVAMAAHRSVNGFHDSRKCWSVTEPDTGLSLIHGRDSLKDAKEYTANKLAKVGYAGFQSAIRTQLAQMAQAGAQ